MNALADMRFNPSAVPSLRKRRPKPKNTRKTLEMNGLRRKSRFLWFSAGPYNPGGLGNGPSQNAGGQTTSLLPFRPCRSGFAADPVPGLKSS